MSRKKEWKWNPRKELAAQLLAQSSYHNTELSRRLGISRTTLYAWQQAPEFVERVSNNSKEFKGELKERFFEEYEVRPNWREEILKKVVQALDDVHPVELEPLKSTPTTLINLALRLQEAVDLKEKRASHSAAYWAQACEGLEDALKNKNRIIAHLRDRLGLPPLTLIEETPIANSEN